MNLTKTQLIFVGAIGFIIILLGLIFTGVLPGLQKERKKPIEATLEFWGISDSGSAYETAINDFKTAYPAVTIRYQSWSDEENYKNALLDALAAGKGPDIFVVKNDELAREINKISAAPQTKFNLLRLRELFPKTVELDFVSKNSIYALPLSIDTLAVIYNRDFLSQAGVAAPPETWEDFKPLIKRLTKFDSTQNIEKAGAAIGGYPKNIDNAIHLLYALMLQTGTKMTDSGFREATFASKEGNEALKFYLQFADPKNQSYTWNETMPNSLDAISQGKTAMIFNYASSISKIKSRSPFMDLGVTSFPQPKSASQSLTYANYWGYTVSLQSKNKNIAWDFIISLTTKTGNAKSYLEKTKRPPALRSLIEEFATNPELSVFAKQALIARSWPQTDPEKISAIFAEAIGLALSKKSTPEEALARAEEQVTELIKRKAF